MNKTEFRIRMIRTGKKVQDVLEALPEYGIAGNVTEQKVSAVLATNVGLSDRDRAIKNASDLITQKWMHEKYERTKQDIALVLDRNGVDVDLVKISFMDFNRIAVFEDDKFAGVYFEETKRFMDYRTI